MRLYDRNMLWTREEMESWPKLELYTPVFNRLMFEVWELSKNTEDNEAKQRLVAVANELAILAKRSEGDFSDKFEIETTEEINYGTGRKRDCTDRN